MFKHRELNISSTAVQGSREDFSAYSISKLGVKGLSEIIQDSSVKHDLGVRVSTVYPGVTDAAIVRGLDLGFEPKSMALTEDIACSILLTSYIDREPITGKCVHGQRKENNIFRRFSAVSACVYHRIHL